MLWIWGKASGRDSVKDKRPGPASSTELEGSLGCSAMNQRVPSGGEPVCLLHSPCHRSKPYRHQASPHRRSKQQFPIYLQQVKSWKIQSTGAQSTGVMSHPCLQHLGWETGGTRVCDSQPGQERSGCPEGHLSLPLCVNSLLCTV